MGQITFLLRLSVLGICASCMLLSGCSSLHDVDYKWCEQEPARAKNSLQVQPLSE